MTSLRTAVLVGNPQAPGRAPSRRPRTVARRLTDAEPGLVVDLATVGPALLDWQDPSVAALVDELGAADLVVVASPTYKATYTGLLKLFLDRFAGGVGLRGVARPADARRRAPPRARRGAAPPARSSPSSGPPSPHPRLFVLDHEHDRPRGLRRLAGAGPPL